MMLLAAPNWSFGRSNHLLRQVRDLLDARPLEVHFCAADVDHNRTVTAFSGEHDDVEEALFALCELVLPAIDLNRHVGCHPRIGGLDVCPFIPWSRPESGSLREQVLSGFVDRCARRLAEEWELPVFLYEHSSPPGTTRRLPAIRNRGFGGLIGQVLEPDYGPDQVHRHLGASVVGWRDFLIALNVNLQQESGALARTLAEKIRIRRKDDPLFAGIRAMGFILSSRAQSQLSMNLTKPDEVQVDKVLQWASDSARRLGVMEAGFELIGVIREADLPGAALLEVRPEQVVQIR